MWSAGRSVAPLVAVVGVVIAGCAAATPDVGPPLPQLPPMGWNSWNSGILLTEESVKSTIDAMVGSGMRDAGYRYVNLDAGWADPTRDRAGELRADPSRFPDGIAELARYAHDRGMLFGLYSSPYNEICGQLPGNASAGHEAADARTFAAWGVDYLKYDWCRPEANHADQVRVFTAMRDALRSSGRHIVYSINPNSSNDAIAGLRYDWTGIADMTRNTIDLLPLWGDTTPNGGESASSSLADEGVPALTAASSPVAGRSRPGHWNDPDMLVVGISWAEFVRGHLGMLAGLAMPGSLTADQFDQAEQLAPLTPEVVTLIGAQRPSLTDDEQRAHFTLWAMLAAPLLAGNDIRTMSEQTRAILTNRDIVAVDQDPLVAQGRPLSGDRRIMVKPLADGSVAVALFNPAGQPVDIGTSVTAIGLTKSACYTVRDLWTHTGSTTTGDIGARAIPAHAVAVLRVSPNCP